MSQSPLTVALFGNTHQERKSAAVQKFLAVAAERELRLVIARSFHDFLRDGLQISVPRCIVADDEAQIDADFAVCMGGDGTFLDVAARLAGRPVPMLGFNTGRLGFLASFSPDDIEAAVADLLAGRYTVEPRSVLSASAEGGELLDYPCALNEVAVLKHDSSSMISIHTSIDGETLTTYQADGLIIGTPTGSTAYSLSVGGPIVVPRSRTVTLTPVAPHSLNMRPLVLCDDCEIEIRVESRSHNFLVAFDGRGHSYAEGLRLSLRRAPYDVPVVARDGHTFFSTLRRKMMWGADQRQ